MSLFSIRKTIRPLLLSTSASQLNSIKFSSRRLVSSQSHQRQHNQSNSSSSSSFIPFLGGVTVGLSACLASSYLKDEQPEAQPQASLELVRLPPSTSPVPSPDSLPIIPDKPPSIVDSTIDTLDSSKPRRDVMTVHSIADVVEAVSPAVVYITAKFAVNRLERGLAMGSGFIINESGHVVTNAHVVTHNMKLGELSVTLPNGRIYPAKVIGIDRNWDLAVLKIEPKPDNKPFPYIKLGSSRELRPGDWLVAIGNPLGLRHTVTAGIASAVSRELYIDLTNPIGSALFERGNGPAHRSVECIQTDAAVSQGSSGGPVLNMKGEVVGITNATVLNYQGASFAIAMDKAKLAIDQLIKFGRVKRPWLGLKLANLEEADIAELKQEDPEFPSIENGVLIGGIDRNSPSAKQGLKEGDIIVEFGGKEVRSTKDIVDRIGLSVGETFDVKVFRGQEKKVFHITAEELKSP